MPSSTDTATPLPHGALAWHRWLRSAVIGCVALPVACFVLLTLIDPYDTGRPVPLGLRGTPADAPRLAHVARARDPRYHAAVFGNSHVQLLSPDRLGQATGFETVSLTVPGSGVREKVALLAWFVHHRQADPAMLVFGVDEFECATGDTLLQTNPFPFWLYETRTAAYLRGLFNTRALGAAAERLALAVRGRLAPPDNGYWDYEAGRTWTRPTLPAQRLTEGAETVPSRFRGVDRLGAALAPLPAGTRVVLVRPPVHASRRPAPGTPAALADAACVAALQGVVDSRPGTVLLDYRNDDLAWADPDHFWDDTHYRRPVAERIERDIAQAVRFP